MVKRTDSTGNWVIWDSERNGYNDVPELYPSISDAEYDNSSADLLSNGFKLRVTNATHNASGGTYIYACFAENPFKYSNAR